MMHAADQRDGTIVTFYSYKGGTGRTMALANVAWILASAGKKVLVADWDLEAPGLDRFFAPFLPISPVTNLHGVIDMVRAYEEHVSTETSDRSDGWLARLASVRPHVVPLRWPFPDDGRLDLLTAGRQNGDYSASLAALDWDTFYERLGGADFLDALRDGLRADYDYALIDSRTGLSDVADICTLHLPDVLIDCYTLSDQGIQGAATVARKVALLSRRPAPHRPVRILPVAMRVDDGEKQKLDAGRAEALRSFPHLPSGMSDDERTQYFLDVEVPYQTFYAYEETLSTFFDEPIAKRGLLAAYQRLTGFITDHGVTAMPPIDEVERERWQRRFSRSARPERPPTRIRYSARDNLWAEWVVGVLNAHEIEVTDDGPVESTEELPPTFDTVLTIVSSSYLAIRPNAVEPDLWLRTPHLVLVVDDSRLPSRQSATRSSIAHLSAEAARNRLLNLVGIAPDRTDTDDVTESVRRYPGSSPDPSKFKAPARNDRFTGRLVDLQRLRDQLRDVRRAVVTQIPVALHGLGGVGKTQLAIEYVHRFAPDYDVVWWIDASQPQFVDSALIDLGRRLNLVTSATLESARATLDGLESPELTSRWLLVYDNAEDPDAIKDLIPTGGAGHVLITSRNKDWETRAQTVPVDVFRRAESITHLLGRTSALTREQADQVAGTLGDLPIAIAAAGAYLAETGVPVADYLDSIRSGVGQPQLPGEIAIERTWDLSLTRLQEQSPGGHRLLQVCSVMATDIALDLLYSDTLMAAVAAVDPVAGERAMRPALVHSINRLALLKLDTQSRQVQVHRVLQESVRRRMSTEEQERTRHEVHLALAAFRPSGEPDDPSTWDRFRIIWPHLRISEAEWCNAEDVRALMIARVRYMWQRGDFERGRELGLKVAEQWDGLLTRIEAPGTEPPVSDVPPQPLRRQLLELRFTIANILRDEADFEGALELDRQVLAQQKDLLGAGHANTLRTAGSYAADLRALGRFRESLPLAEENYQAWRDGFGETDLRTLAAANNLAEAMRTVGDFGAALRIDQGVYARRRELLGDNHRYTLHSQAALGRDRREAGEYAESVVLLREVVERSSQHLGDTALGTLNAMVSLAASLRGMGEVTEAAELLEAAYGALTQRFGVDSPSTLVCELTRAGNLLTLGEAEKALAEMRTVTRAYYRKLGEDHPFSLVCANNQAAAEQRNGDTTEALRLASCAARGCERQLGRLHPYYLAAAMNEAACLFDLGETEGAVTAMREIAGLMESALGPRHPDYLLCRANLAVITAAGAEAVHALQERVGDDHPAVRELFAGRVVYRVTDPLEPF